MIFDTHIHTKHSPDSAMELTDAMAAAQEHNVGLTITEHYDYGMTGRKAGSVDCQAFFRAYTPHRSEKLYLGIELGLTHAAKEVNLALSQAHPFDYILGAVHMMDALDIRLECLNNPKPRFQPQEYLAYNLAMVQENPYIHSLAHIDYISRYGNCRGLNMRYNDYAYLYDQLFEALLENHTLLELNSRRLGDSEALHCYYEIYSRYYGLGGRFVTLGSDAHYIRDIALNFQNALGLAEDIGLTPVYFKEGVQCPCAVTI